MKKMSFILFLAAFFAYGCGGGADETGDNGSSEEPQSMVEDEQPQEAYTGRIKEVQLNDPLDQALVEKGKGIYEMKCSACHKLTDQRVVGPGWKGVTKQRDPVWIMNMITDPDAMLANDPAAQELLKECLVRMPNQNLSDEDARAVLEFMFANDAE